jgi:hypothetical protein
MKKLNIQRPGEAPTNGEPAYGDKSPFLAETAAGFERTFLDTPFQRKLAHVAVDEDHCG